MATTDVEPSLSQEGGGLGLGLGSPVGVRLEAVMEQLQRHQEAKLEMDRQEKHLRQAQMMFAKQVAVSRATGAPLDSAFLGKRVEVAGTDTTPQMGRPQTGLGGNNIYASSLSGVYRGCVNGEDGLGGQGSDEEEDDQEERVEGEESSEDDEVGVEHGHMTKMSPLQPERSFSSFPVYSTSPLAVSKHRPISPPMNVKQEAEEKDLSPTEQHSFTSPNGFGDWSFDDGPFKQKGSVGWAEENEGGKARGEPSRDFAKLYELDSDPNRKEFLDELFVFMQKRGTPVNRIPIMAKQVLDLYMLYKLVTEKGGLVEVINKKIWREITKGLHLPTSITSAAFTLRTQYMKYLYPYECEKKRLSSPGELQAAIDGNRREGRRPSYSNSLYRFSPSSSTAAAGQSHHSLLSSPKMLHRPSAGHNGLRPSPGQSLKRPVEEMSASMLPGHARSLGQQQQQMAQAASLEHLREKLERATGVGAGGGEGHDRKMARLAVEEQQRMMQQAFQHNLLAMASHFNPGLKQLRLNNGHESTNKQDLSLSISTNGAASISVSVEVNGTLYSGMLFAQKPPSGLSATSETMPPAGQSGFSVFSSSHSPSSSASSSSSKGAN
ncbi:AT-rich interactive domain-containing protein 3B isoform X2 [Esox lucius]|uniref:AT-rich interactive domain-containing protein 3B isoform X2 n=1 Tax=Esox lucius TaxID=8010 RepID=UPI0009734C3A|nr:AT-rich interactive domain-containing protein 3B isoform X2 [Esox lucius]